MLRHFAPDLRERHLLSRFWKSAARLWHGPEAWRVWLLTLGLIALVLSQLLLQYRMNYWNRDFFNALERRDRTAFSTQILLFVPLAAAIIALASVSVWGRMTLQRKWREWLSAHLYGCWLRDGRYRKLRFIAGDHAAPEYRIAEDARVATDAPVDLVLGLLSSTLTAITFIGVLWRVGGDLRADVPGLSVAVPGYLVIAAVTYSALITASMMFVARHLTQAVEGKNRAEAELRSVSAHLREDGEHWSPSPGSVDETAVIRPPLDHVIAQWLRLCWLLTRMTVISYGSTIVTPIAGLLLCMPKYLSGTMSLGEAVQAAAAFVMVQGAFNWVTDNYGRLADWMSSANRIASLLIALDLLSEERD